LLNAEPERPSRRNPGVPLDLETICLKCLEKIAGQALRQRSGAGRRSAPLSMRRADRELIIWPLTEAAAEEYGRIAAELKRTGRPIGKIDMLPLSP
jgi:predicted nucleic acid-binding protein